MSDRAVSDVLGYVLVFSLIISTVGLVYTTGLSGLDDVRQSEKFTNAERAFDVLDSNIGDLAHGTGVARGTEIKLQDAAIRFGDPVVINVSTDAGESYVGELTPIYFTGANRDTRIVSVDGAIMREENSGSAMLNEPGFLFGDKLVVPMLVTRTREVGEAGSGRVLIRTVVADRSVVRLAAPDAGDDVTISVNSSRVDAWENYLSAESGNDCSVSGDTVSCRVPADEVYIQVVKIDVSLT